MQQSTFTFDGYDGLTVHVYKWAPDGDAKGVLQIAHGMAEHGGRYGRLAEVMTGAGYVVYANDHRGHGKTIPAGQAPGHMANRDGWTKAVADVQTLNRRIADENPGLPIVFFGHSMGSFMGQQMLYEHPGAMKGAILSGSNGKPPAIATIGKALARVERLRVGRGSSSGVLTMMSFGDFNKRFKPNRTEFDWLSRDPDEVDKYVDDPLCGFPVSTQCWVDFIDALGVIASPQNQSLVPKDMPVFAFSGDMDPVGDMGAGVQRLVEDYRAAGLTDVTVTLYPEGRHEMVNETNRDEVMGDVLAFCERVVSA